jgi:hypothetical protein
MTPDAAASDSTSFNFVDDIRGRLTIRYEFARNPLRAES